MLQLELPRAHGKVQGLIAFLSAVRPVQPHGLTSSMATAGSERLRFVSQKNVKHAGTWASALGARPTLRHAISSMHIRLC